MTIVEQLLKRHADEHPAKLAIRDVEDPQSISWADLYSEVMDRAKGTRPSVVPWPDNSIDDIIDWLAGWVAGAKVCAFFSSGSTGHPKKVEWEWEKYQRNGAITVDMLGLTANDRILECRPLKYNSAQITSIVPWLQLGCTLYIAEKFSLSRFAGWVNNNQITFAAAVPKMIELLVEHQREQPEMPSMLIMSCSAAPLSTVLWKRFETVYGTQLLPHYGMSEVGRICGSRPNDFKYGTVGKPVAGISFEIDHGEVIANGIRTGDLAVQDEQGFVTLRGRIKPVIRDKHHDIAELELPRLPPSVP